MKKILLPEKNEQYSYYRANLHCHSTISDGRKTPEQLKRDYMAHGYSVIAYTDHDVFIPHNDLSDDTFIALNGYEVEVNEGKPTVYETGRTCHMCFVSLDKENDKAVCWHRSKYFGNNPHAANVKFDESLPDYERVYTPECINDMIDKAKKGGFFVTYNHPVWSIEAYPEFSNYEGMDAMEIVNFACFAEGYDDDNGHFYEDLLRQGKRLFCIAADDNHNWHDDSDPLCGSYGGYTMIGAPSLTYENIAEGLRNGCFYAAYGDYVNPGPEILSLVYEDGKVKIKTSDARSIAYMTGRRKCMCKGAEDGKTINEAEFEVGEEKWFRLTVTDNRGYKAYTNAYFTDTLR